MLEEFGLDQWLTIVRETRLAGDPTLRLIYLHSALVRCTTGKPASAVPSSPAAWPSPGGLPKESSECLRPGDCQNLVYLMEMKGKKKSLICGCISIGRCLTDTLDSHIITNTMNSALFATVTTTPRETRGV